jgi:hypothetical protein
MTGTKEGMESLIYTGTAPNGFKSIAKKAVAQKSASSLPFRVLHVFSNSFLCINPTVFRSYSPTKLAIYAFVGAADSVASKSRFRLLLESAPKGDRGADSSGYHKSRFRLLLESAPKGDRGADSSGHRKSRFR